VTRAMPIQRGLGRHEAMDTSSGRFV